MDLGLSTSPNQFPDLVPNIPENRLAVKAFGKSNFALEKAAENAQLSIKEFAKQAGISLNDSDAK